MELLDDVVRKRGSAEHLAVERAKSEAARLIGESTGLFCVPKVCDLGEDHTVLEFERLKGLVTLEVLAVREDRRLPAVLARVGQSLRAVHEHLVLGDEMKALLPDEWMSAGGNDVFIHGDFTLGNVCLEPDTDRIVLIDWSTAPMLGRTPTYGSPCFDLQWFVGSTFESMPRAMAGRWNAEAMADAFLRGYGLRQDTGVLATEYDRLTPVMDVLYRARMQQRAVRYTWPRRWLYRLFQRWIYRRWFRYRLPG